jgi:hypothetical protein
MGRYTRDACSHNSKPTYKGTRLVEGMAIWFSDGDWCIGSKEYIGTRTCYIYAEECARTPAAVQSVWMAETSTELDEGVQVCSALVQQKLSATASHVQHAPPKLAIVGSDTEGVSYDGVYTKQQCAVDSRVAYEGGRNGKQAVWYLDGKWSGWCIGQAEFIGTDVCNMIACDPAVAPDAITEPWNVPLMEPCNSFRVTKSKKKHTKVIEVKGVPTDGLGAQMNGKYRPSCMVGGRPTFKGGQDGKRVLWFDERRGKWQGGHEDFVGMDGPDGGFCAVDATDDAASPNAVKAVWHVRTSFEPSPYPNVIVPSVEAAKQEVPRLVKLKMCKLVVAQHKRCLGCGHEYTAQTEVLFQIACMHHHCVCCGKEDGGMECAVCAEEGGE